MHKHTHHIDIPNIISLSSILIDWRSLKKFEFYQKLFVVSLSPNVQDVLKLIINRANQASFFSCYFSLALRRFHLSLLVYDVIYHLF